MNTKKQTEPALERVVLRLPTALAEFVEANPIPVQKILQDWLDKNFALTGEGTEEPMLHRAQALIQGQRQEDYGDKLQNFSQIAMLWQGYLAPKLQHHAAITPEDVALCMILVKMARLAKSPDHKDSVLDIAGYAGCYDTLQAERAYGYFLAGATRDPRTV